MTPHRGREVGHTPQGTYPPPGFPKPSAVRSTTPAAGDHGQLALGHALSSFPGAVQMEPAAGPNLEGEHVSNSHQDLGDRYVIIEIPPEATATEFEQIATGVLDFVETFNAQAPRGNWDLFGFTPHSHQEQVLRELFGGEGT